MVVLIITCLYYVDAPVYVLYLSININGEDIISFSMIHCTSFYDRQFFYTTRNWNVKEDIMI